MISRRSLLAGLAVAPGLRPQTAWADPPAEEVPPLLGEGTVAVAVVDFARGDPMQLVGGVIRAVAPANLRPAPDRPWADQVRALAAAGATRLHLIVDIADQPGRPLLAARVGPGGDPRGLIAAMNGVMTAWQVVPAAGELIRGWAVVGRADAVARLRDATPSDRPDLRAALAEGGADAAVRVAISPGRTTRRAVEEAMVELPAELGGGPTRFLTRGMAWVALRVSGDLRTGRLTVQADGPDSARVLHRIVQLGLEAAARGFADLPATRELAPRLTQDRPILDGSRVVADLDPETVLALVAVPLARSRAGIAQAEAMNHLRLLGLALHNYHSRYGSFPPAYRADPAGRPLLSWRVLILPYLDHDDLFRQFTLDEPWDSLANKPLLARMPPAFAAPSLPPELAAAGKTAYLTARGPESVFPGATGIKIGEVTDGLDSTVLVLEAGPAEAVPWTKPDDANAGAIAAALAGREWAAALGDGSARRFRPGVPADVIRSLLTRQGGEAIDWSKL